MFNLYNVCVLVCMLQRDASETVIYYVRQGMAIAGEQVLCQS